MCPGALDFTQTSGPHALLADEALGGGAVDLGPFATCGSRRETREEPMFIQSADLAVDPAVRQRTFGGFGFRDTWVGCALLWQHDASTRGGRGLYSKPLFPRSV